MRYRTIGQDPKTRRTVSALSLGAMLFGTSTDEATAFAILDRFVEAGGTFVDTSNNYAFWHDRTQGGESEALLGRWRASRGIGDEVTIATKLGVRPNAAGLSFADTAKFENIEGLSAKAIRASANRSRELLGVDRLPLLGVSNHWSWRVERARALAHAADLPGYEVLQYHYTYLRPRTDLPSRRSPEGNQGLVAGDLLTYLKANPELTLVAYSPLLSGAYVRDDKPMGAEYEHPGTPQRLAVLREVAKEVDATLNQVVLAWLMGRDIPVIPLVGASSVAQLEESLAAVDLTLTPDQRARLDGAH